MQKQQWQPAGIDTASVRCSCEGSLKIDYSNMGLGKQEKVKSCSQGGSWCTQPLHAPSTDLAESVGVHDGIPLHERHLATQQCLGGCKA